MTLDEENNVLFFRRPGRLPIEAKEISKQAYEVYVLNGSAPVIFPPESRQEDVLAPFENRRQRRHALVSRLSSSTKDKIDTTKAALPPSASRTLMPELPLEDRRDLERAENEGMLVDNV